MAHDMIEREIIIDAPVARVWDALTVPEQISGWFGDRAEIDLRPGGAANFFWNDFGSFLITVERVEPQRVFAYRWAREANQPPTAGNSTLVEFTLTPEGDGTRLRVVETGFTSLDMPEEEQARNWEMNTQGWGEELGELREFVQRVAA
jgi:uncharacterized protein YndB with AHSA1/START domain